MPVTINVNKLTLAHKGSEGISNATLPDVCLVPPIPVPVPFPNTSFSEDLIKGTTTVTADGGNMIAIDGSEFQKSVGDEPGTGGGILSGVHMRESTWLSFSFDVKCEGKSVCRLTDKKLHNHGNTVNMAGLMQKFLKPLMEYGKWCGPDKAPYEDYLDTDPGEVPKGQPRIPSDPAKQIPADESEWLDWVRREFPEADPGDDKVDQACMKHDLRLAQARQTNPSVSAFSGHLETVKIHLQLIGDLVKAIPSAGFMGWLFILRAVPVFIVMALANLILPLSLAQLGPKLAAAGIAYGAYSARTQNTTPEDAFVLGIVAGAAEGQAAEAAEDPEGERER